MEPRNPLLADIRQLGLHHKSLGHKVSVTFISVLANANVLKVLKAARDQQQLKYSS